MLHRLQGVWLIRGLCVAVALLGSRLNAADAAFATLTPEQISALIAVTPDLSGDNSQLNWQQWGEAEASAQSIVDAPVADWGILPDAATDATNELAALPSGSNQSLTNWLAFAVKGQVYRVKRLMVGASTVGEASWYGPGFHGRQTASGEIYNMHALTAAHRTLPLPSYVRVTYLANGKTVIVKINDRGPYHGNRIIDLSYAAAQLLGIVGVGRVALESVKGEEREGNVRAGIPLKSEPAYSVLLGNFINAANAVALQDRLVQRLPPGIPVSIKSTPGPLLIRRVEVGPLASPQDVSVLIRSIRASRMSFAEEPVNIRPSKAY